MPENNGESGWDEMMRRLRNHLFERDVEPFRPVLLRYCRRLAGDPDRGQDLLQSTLLRGFDRFCRICGEPINTKAFLFRIATNLWIDQLRKQKRDAALNLRFAEDGLAQSRDAEAVETMISLSQSLSPREFQVFQLHQVAGYTARETALLLGTSESAVKMAASRARRRGQINL
jgi:RNA polymerase sigma-70 factor (ECF subfamily)